MFTIFLSYPTAADRRHEITEFRRELEASLREKTGSRTLRIFQDSEAIELGESWRDRLSRELAEVPILMPIVQPLYLSSEWCVRELVEFHRRLDEQRMPGRILPVLWEPVRHAGDAAGLAWSILEPLHHFDWTAFRRRDWDEAKRLALDRLATGIADVLAAIGAEPHEDGVRPPVARDPVAVSFKLSAADQVTIVDADGGAQQIPCSGCTLRIVVEATTEQSVVLLGIRSLILERRAPAGSLQPSAGIAPLRRFTLRLDAAEPGLESNEQGVDFPFRISRDDPEVIEVECVTLRYHVVFALELDWVCAGRQGTTRIDFGGRPFHCMARPPAPAYEWPNRDRPAQDAR